MSVSLATLKITDGRGHLLDDACERVFSHIFYPDDEPQRRAFLKALSVESDVRVARLDDSGDLSVQATARIATRIEKIVEAAARDGQGSAIAGELLLIVLNLAAYRPQEASLRRARQLFAGEQTEIAASERPLKVAWRQFGSVAHLGAAMRLYRDGLLRGDYQLDPTNPRSLPLFLAVSEALRIAGTTHHPPLGRTGSKFARITTLDLERTWRTPPDLMLPSAFTRIPELTQYVETRLRHYSAPRKLRKTP